MKYRVLHRTTYRYETPASVSHNVLFLTPRRTARQTVLAHRIEVTPEPNYRVQRTDIFGNRYEVIAVDSPHRELTIAAESHAAVLPPPQLYPERGPTVRETALLVKYPADEESRAAAEFACPSPSVPLIPAVSAYAAHSLLPDRPLLEAGLALTERIFSEFQYDPRATTVSTPVQTVLANRRGVCQDFSHLMISCLRSAGLAARYVSGYLETLPPPGKPKLVGADASHAWVSLWVPGSGWVDLDPTNNLIPGERHITAAWGREYGDTAPVRGVVSGGGADTLEVSVDVSPLDKPAQTDGSLLGF